MFPALRSPSCLRRSADATLQEDASSKSSLARDASGKALGPLGQSIAAHAAKQVPREPLLGIAICVDLV